jgi:hypothetical protein
MARFVDMLTPTGGRIWINPDQVVRIEGGVIISLAFSDGECREVAATLKETLDRLQGSKGLGL